MPSLATAADRLTARLADATPALGDGRPEVLPATIALAAEVVRFLRAEPLLPRRADARTRGRPTSCGPATASSTGSSAARLGAVLSFEIGPIRPVVEDRTLSAG